MSAASEHVLNARLILKNLRNDDLIAHVRGQALTDIARDTISLTKLQRLDVSDNQLTSLNALAIPSLTTLTAHHNQIRRLIIVGEFLRSLKSLDVSYNPVTTVVALTGCANLTAFIISNARLSELPVRRYQSGAAVANTRRHAQSPHLNCRCRALARSHRSLCESQSSRQRCLSRPLERSRRSASCDSTATLRSHCCRRASPDCSCSICSIWAIVRLPRCAVCSHVSRWIASARSISKAIPAVRCPSMTRFAPRSRSLSRHSTRASVALIALYHSSASRRTSSSRKSRPRRILLKILLHCSLLAEHQQTMLTPMLVTMMIMATSDRKRNVAPTRAVVPPSVAQCHSRWAHSANNPILIRGSLCSFNTINS
jgi:Leucine-rich repeat (LRR) protein